MKMIKLECPNCGSNLEVRDNVNKCFCTYCGVSIVLYDKTMIKEQGKTTRQAIRSNADMYIADREVEIKKLDNEARKTESDSKYELVYLFVIVLIMLLMFIAALWPF